MHDFMGVLLASRLVTVLVGWLFIACEKLCCLHRLLYSFTKQGSAVWTPHSDAAAAVALSPAHEKHSENIQSNVEFQPIMLIQRDLKLLTLSSQGILIVEFPPRPCYFLMPAVILFTSSYRHIQLCLYTHIEPA